MKTVNNRNRVRVLTAILATASLATLAACSSSDETAPATPDTTNVVDETDTEVTPAAEIEITEAWARSIPGGRGAVYATVSSPVDDEIVAARVTPESVAGKVEIHEVVTDADGKMKMQMVERIPVLAGEPTMLKPGGYHVMLMEMAEMLPVGSSFKVTLVFANAGEVTFDVQVQEDSAEEMSGDMDMDMDSGDMDMDSGDMGSDSMNG